MTSSGERLRDISEFSAFTACSRQIQPGANSEVGDSLHKAPIRVCPALPFDPRSPTSFSFRLRSSSVLEMDAILMFSFLTNRDLLVGRSCRSGKTGPRRGMMSDRPRGGAELKESKMVLTSDSLPSRAPKSCPKPAIPMLSNEMQFILHSHKSIFLSQRRGYASVTYHCCTSITLSPLSDDPIIPSQTDLT